jgi:hypothetical protein
MRISLNVSKPAGKYPYITGESRSLTTWDARIIPATGGTKDVLPGTWRRSVHLRFVSGGQTQ